MRLIEDILALNTKYEYQKLIIEYLFGNSNPYIVPIRIKGEVVGKYKIDTSSFYGFQAGRLYIDENITAKNFLEYKTRNFNIRHLPSIGKEINLNINCKLSRDILLNIPKVNIYYEEKFRFDEDMKRGVKNVRKRSK